MDQQYEQKIRELEKENRILEKKLHRSRTNLAMLEETNDRKEALLNQVISDQKSAEIALALRSEENAKLYQQSQANAHQLEQALNELKISEEQVRQQNEQLAIANIELARVSRLKDEFLATVSHELRTPLTGILGMSELLTGEFLGSLNRQQLESIATIEDCGQHLLRLIEDILDLTRIESGHMDIILHPCEIDKLCQISLNAIAPVAAKKKIYLNSIIPANLRNIEVDEKRLHQVLDNLLSNAIKFTPEGGQILLTVEVDQSHQQLHIHIKDTGIGIPEHELEHIFDRFFQVDGKLNRQHGGLGIGLAIVKRIVGLHQGSISVCSKVGEGSRFTIHLPYTSTLPTDGEATQSYILIAEDDHTTARIVIAYLKSYGYRFEWVQNGKDAVRYAEREKPALILMDIQMPIMNGLEAMRLIRKNPNLRTIPIIAATALAMQGDEEVCLQAGATEYMSKPFRLKHLLSRIDICLIAQRDQINNRPVWK
jgi:signal transduction histidine kinase/CheY-like chemotaxis protein